MNIERIEFGDLNGTPSVNIYVKEAHGSIYYKNACMALTVDNTLNTLRRLTETEVFILLSAFEQIKEKGAPFPNIFTEVFNFTKHYIECDLGKRRFIEDNDYQLCNESIKPSEFLKKINADVIGDLTELDKRFTDNHRIREAVMRLPDDNRRHILLKELGLLKK